MINEGVTAALAARDTTRNGDDSHSSGVGIRRPVQVARECTYPDFLKCQPLNFKGTEGVVGLTRWFEKMESVFSISNCTTASQVKFATCTLQDDALTWWNAHVKTTTPETAHAMPWATLKKKMTDKYCPRGEIKKIEAEMTKLKDISVWLARYDTLVAFNGIKIKNYAREKAEDYARTTDSAMQTMRQNHPEGPMPQGLLTGDNSNDPDLGVLVLISPLRFLVLQKLPTSATRFGTLIRDSRLPKCHMGHNQGGMVVECGARTLSRWD
ncbi:reverse transcriptase domain-containing protein [Tanacetum coccineum]